MKKDKSKIIYKSQEYIYDLQSKKKKRLALVQVHGLLLLLLDVISANQEGRNGLGGPEPCRCREKKGQGGARPAAPSREVVNRKQGVFSNYKSNT